MGKVKTEARRAAVILAEMMEVGEFLPGSVRRDWRKKRRADGSLVRYEVEPRLNCVVGGARKDIRIPKAAYARAVELTANYRRLKALFRELEEAAVRDNLPDGAKKNS